MESLQTIRERVAAQAANGRASSNAIDDMGNDFAYFSALARTILQVNQALIKRLDDVMSVKVTNQAPYPTTIATPDVEAVVAAVKQLDKTVKTKTDDDSAVIAAINDVTKQLKSLPGAIKIPEAAKQRADVALNNVEDITGPLEVAISDLNASLRGLKLDPKIQVAAPNVHVDAPDFTRLETMLKEVLTAIKAIKIPEPKPIDLSKVTTAADKTTKAIKDLRFPASSTPTDPLIKYTPADIDDAGTVQYFGFIDNSGGWYIRKYDTSVSPKTMRFAFGNGGAAAYSTAFAGRAGLVYSLWSQ